MRTASGINIALGVWLIISSWVFVPGAPFWNNIIIGALVIIFGWVRVATPNRNTWASWLNVIMGLWLIAAPWALYFAAYAGAAWNSIIVGIVIAILGIWSALAVRPRAA